jgi:hypothetical protein
MLGSLRVLLLTATYTIVGVGLAWLWYRGQYGLVGALALIALLLAAAVAPLARRLITTQPMLALHVFEAYSWVNGLLAAVVTSTTVVVTIEFAKVTPAADPDKELLKQVGAAIIALIGGLVVATKDVDATLGKHIEKEFQAKFTLEGAPAPGKVGLKKKSKSLIAVFTRYANNWTDWSKDNRHARVLTLQENLVKDRV